MLLTRPAALPWLGRQNGARHSPATDDIPPRGPSARAGGCRPLPAPSCFVLWAQCSPPHPPLRDLAGVFPSTVKLGPCWDGPQAPFQPHRPISNEGKKTLLGGLAGKSTP